MRTVDPHKHAARREAILDAAVVAFAAKGYESTTVKDLCAAAGVGSGTLFHYFADKRAILHAFVERDVQQLEAALTELETVPTAEPEDQLWAIVDRLSYEVADPIAGAVVVMLIPQMFTDEAIAEMYVRADAHAHTVLTRAIERIDTDLAPERAATWIQQIIDGLYLRCMEEGFDAEAELAMLREVIRRLLGLSR